MDSLLFVGLFIGMRHALEADHMAAVASLMHDRQSMRQALRQGGVWGLGHTITLFLFGSVVIFMDWVIPEHLASGLELAVGVMLVLLGSDVLLRLVRNRVHFHGHRHGDDHYHFHAHSHAGESRSGHDPARHRHRHLRGFPLRALFVGMMHGMAGSAAVILLALGAVTSPLQGMLYILSFGVGSIFGMALLSLIISIPLRASAGRLAWMHKGFQALAGTVTVGLGFLLLYTQGQILMH
jgi:hypothetical protein